MSAACPGRQGPRRFWRREVCRNGCIARSAPRALAGFESADGHLLYARALEESGRLAEAADEYEDVSSYYTGAEPRVRLGLALRELGREVDARDVLSDVVKRIELAPRYVRKTQAEWLAMARQALKV
jgi:hypothetical protein